MASERAEKFYQCHFLILCEFLIYTRLYGHLILLESTSMGLNSYHVMDPSCRTSHMKLRKWVCCSVSNGADRSKPGLSGLCLIGTIASRVVARRLECNCAPF